MNRRPHRVTNSRAAVHSIIYAPPMVEERTPDLAKDEIMEVLPKKRIPGTALLKKLARDREKQKMKHEMTKEATRAIEPLINPDAVREALARILADLEN